MKILLINVCIRYETPVKHVPVGLACIATALDKADFKPDIFDIDLYEYNVENIRDFLENNNDYDIVGLGNIISGYKFTKIVANIVKDVMPNTLLIVGNTVATSAPEILLKCIPSVDIAVLGEGDRTVVDIVKVIELKKDWRSVPGIAYRNGDRIEFTEPRKGIPLLADLPFPDYSLFDINSYIELSNKTVSEPLPPIPFKDLKALPVNTARGCLFNCSFCGHAFKGYKYRFYPFKNVIDFIDGLQRRYGINYIHFWDELTFFSRRRLEELCYEIERSGIQFNWIINARPNTFNTRDIDLLKRAKDLGALVMGGAFESADEGILKAMNKHLRIEQYVEQVRVAREAGLAVSTSLVFGYPQETKETIKKTINLCRELEVYPSSGFLLPLPKTPIYVYALKHGLIGDQEEYLLKIGDRQDLHINMTKMTDAEFYDTLRNELISLKNDLGIPISDDNVIKTTIYKIARTPNQS